MGTGQAYSKQHFWDLTPDDHQGARPMKDPEWFALFQPLLVQMANTDYGRDLLCIDKHPYPVVELTKSWVKFEKSPGVYMTDHRIGSKWGNIIRHRWLEFRQFAKEFYEIEVDGNVLLRPLLRYKKELVAAAATTTAYPDPHTESSTVDGTLAHLHHSASHTGGPVGCTYTHLVTGLVSASNNESEGTDAGSDSGWHESDTSTTYYQLIGGIASGSSGWKQDFSLVFLFDTSGVGSDTVSAGTFSYYSQETSASGTSGSGIDFSLSNADAAASRTRGALQIMEIDPASTTELQWDDWYDRKSSDADQFSDAISWASGNFPASGSPAYKDISLNSTGLGNVVGDGITKLCTMEATYEIPILKGGTTERTHPGSAKNDEGNCRMSEHTGTSNDPKLVITHATSFIPKTIMF